MKNIVSFIKKYKILILFFFLFVILIIMLVFFLYKGEKESQENEIKIETIVDDPSKLATKAWDGNEFKVNGYIVKMGNNLVNIEAAGFSVVYPDGTDKSPKLKPGEKLNNIKLIYNLNKEFVYTIGVINKCKKNISAEDVQLYSFVVDNSDSSKLKSSFELPNHIYDTSFINLVTKTYGNPSKTVTKDGVSELKYENEKGTSLLLKNDGENFFYLKYESTDFECNEILR